MSLTKPSTVTRVVTGIRFRKVNDVFHLQVEQAELLPSATIDPNTKSWVKVEEYKTTDSDVSEGEDYNKLSWDLRSFELGDIELDKDYVVTGVRFTVDKGLTANEGLIRLDVRGTRFNFQNGKLKVKQHLWHQHTKSKDQLKQFKLEHTDLPPTHPINEDVSYSESSQYITLTTSSMEQDVGQTVVPFVDLQPVVSEHPDVALSGVGLFHKGYKKKAAGYLSVKILTYR
ncbi:uncharacterized protein LOC111694016 [Trichogramma pretiosum]|uniref:uncharacterized protein LOC111694016 n=1 Tax=Trichogramma pretiosum TaxID=7493 RepID=UPI000C71A460|nr:uncharacterized protein LOC111694016 [Trichogramma pretiosum]